jgi:hypothetical protein
MLRAGEKTISFDNFFAPEAQRRLAGGEGAAVTTGDCPRNICVPAGTPDEHWNFSPVLSCAPAGARLFSDGFPVVALRSTTG